MAILTFLFEMSYATAFIFDKLIEAITDVQDSTNTFLFDISVWIQGLAFMALLLFHNRNLQDNQSDIEAVLTASFEKTSTH